MKTECYINLSNLVYNVDQIKKYTNKKIIAVVKANAYGHGAVEVSKALINKVEYLAVSSFSEAIELRENNIKNPILVLGYTSEEEFDEASKHNITITIHNLSQIPVINCPLKVHLKVDTGMNRIGLTNLNDVQEAITLIMKNKYIYLEGIFTHYATADTDIVYFEKQLEKFKFIITKLNYKFDYIHGSNSAASINYKDDFTNAIRPGISMYGISAGLDVGFDLKPVLSLYSGIVQLKKISTGDCIGYGNEYIANEDCIIATVPIGYGDGWLRRNNVVSVFIKNKPYTIVGHICMDMLMIKIDGVVKTDDKVEFIGPNITADEIAIKTKTISYEVVCNLGKRVKRNYIS